MIKVVEVGYGVAIDEPGNVYIAKQKDNETYLYDDNKKEYRVTKYNDNDEVEEIEPVEE